MIDHHNPTELSEKIYQLMTSDDIEASLIAEKLDVPVTKIVGEVLHDRRLVHKFKSDQKYYILLTRFGMKNDV